MEIPPKQARGASPLPTELSLDNPTSVSPRASEPDRDLSASLALRYLVLILIASGLLRVMLWFLIGGGDLQIWDERDYNTLAVNLVKHGEFAFTPGTPISLRPPLYPAIVAGIYNLFGVENFRIVYLLQVGLSLLTLALLYGLGSEVYSRRVGLWLTGLYGFYPSMLAYDHLLLTEVQFTALLCATCYSLVLALRRESFAWLGFSGVLLGLAALTRSVLWPFPVILGAFLLLAWPRPARGRLLAVGVLVGAFSITLAPWANRNIRLEQTFMTVDSMGGRNFMMGNYEYTPLFRAWDAIGIEGSRSWYQVLAKSDPTSVGVTQGQKDKRALRQGLAFVLEHPWLTLKRDTVKFFNFWGLERELIAGAAQGHFGTLTRPALAALTLVIFGSYTAALISGIFGAVMVPPTDRRLLWLLLLIIGFICGMHTLTFGHSRYHLPVMPLVLLYSSATIVHARSIWARRYHKSFLLACGLSIVFVAAWLCEILFVYRDQFLRALSSIG